MNLVEQYFQRDLTEDEKKALDELLERSPEATLLFHKKAGEVSQPLSLPELKLPPLLLPPPKRGSIHLSKWSWVLMGYGLLAAGFWAWSRNHDFHWPWEPPEPAALSSPAVPTARNIPKTASPSTSALSFADGSGTDSDLAMAMGAQPTPEDEELDAANPIPVTALSPSILEHPGLRVIVDRPIPGRVTVTVLDTSGQEIRTLYAGALQAGRWVLEWDGRLADGSRAAIGAYTLQVQSASNVQKQEVWVGQ